MTIYFLVQRTQKMSGKTRCTTQYHAKITQICKRKEKNLQYNICHYKLVTSQKFKTIFNIFKFRL